MSGSAYRDGGNAISEINVTPLVDVVLVLLVIFMVTAPMIAAQGIVVDSPKAATGVAVEGTLTLSITKDGTLLYAFDDQEKTFPAAERRLVFPLLQTHHQKFPESKAIIAGDQAISHGAVMEVIDMVREAGIEKFALRTQMKITKPAPPTDQP